MGLTTIRALFATLEDDLAAIRANEDRAIALLQSMERSLEALRVDVLQLQRLLREAATGSSRPTPRSAGR